MTIKRLEDITALTATVGDSLRHAMCLLERTSLGIVIVCDANGGLLDTVTDGDVRRAILNNVDLDAPLWQLYGQKVRAGNPPISGGEQETDEQLQDRFDKMEVRHVPLLDQQAKVVGLAVQDRSSSHSAPTEVQAVVMAGGFGTRLRPLTDDTPKPMLSIGGRPLLERTVTQLRDSGIRDVRLTTHYLPEKIENHFGNGSRFGVNIQYVSEDRPLGTAGSLKLLPSHDKPLIVINGDILTAVDFGALVRFHQAQEADMTVGVRQYEFKVPHEVIESKNGCATKITQNPSYSFLVNAGIYLIQPTVHRYVPTDQRFDMTDLIDRVMADGGRVVSFPVIEYWLDIGQHEDFDRAQKDVEQFGWVA